MSRQMQYQCRPCGAAILPRICGRSMSIATFRATRISSASQASDVKDQLDLLNADIAVFDASIEAQEATLLMMREKRHELDLSRDRHRGLMAPIRKIPAELLSEIFIYSTALGNFPDEWSTPVQETTKLALLWVCSTWRHVASGMPRLWTSIRVSRDHWFGYKDNTFRRPLNYPLLRHVWLPRSHHEPLTVYIDRPGQEKRGIAAFRTILDLSKRWQSVSLSLTSDEVHILPKRLFLPQLTSLSLSAWECERDEDEQEDIEYEDYLTSPLHLFSEAPALQSVILCDISLDMVKLPRDQITSLKLTDDFSVYTSKLSMRRCLHHMHAYPNLRHFTCTVDEIGSPDIPQDAFPHTSLKTWNLVIDGDESDGSVSLSFFQAVTLPKLQELTLELYNSRLNVFWDHAVFLAFLERSSCIIRSLTLLGIPLDTQDLLDALSRMPTIESLRLDGVVVDEDDWLFRRLTYSDISLVGRTTPPPCILPLLHTLRLCRPFHWIERVYDTATLTEMVSSRMLSEPTEATHQSGLSRTRTRLKMLDMDPKNYTADLVPYASHWYNLGLDVRCDGDPLFTLVE